MKSGPITHLVVIAREGVPQVVEFSSYREARSFFDTASLNWSESYLALAVHGPGRPAPSMPIDPHSRPDIVALRYASASLCIDDECTLSGGYAHAGPCEPCRCPLRHAVEECLDALEHVED